MHIHTNKKAHTYRVLVIEQMLLGNLLEHIQLFQHDLLRELLGGYLKKKKKKKVNNITHQKKCENSLFFPDYDCNKKIYVSNNKSIIIIVMVLDIV